MTTDFCFFAFSMLRVPVPCVFFCAKDGHPSIVLGSEIKGWAAAHFIGKLIEREEEGVARDERKVRP